MTSVVEVLKPNKKINKIAVCIIYLVIITIIGMETYYKYSWRGFIWKNLGFLTGHQVDGLGRRLTFSFNVTVQLWKIDYFALKNELIFILFFMLSILSYHKLKVFDIYIRCTF